MTYKQQEQALIKLKRIIKTIRNDAHLNNMLQNYVYLDDEVAKIDSVDFRSADINGQLKIWINPFHEMIDIFNAEYKDLESKEKEYLREQKIKSILK